jgi:hypothetical protein
MGRGDQLADVGTVTGLPSGLSSKAHSTSGLTLDLDPALPARASNLPVRGERLDGRRLPHQAATRLRPLSWRPIRRRSATRFEVESEQLGPR